MSARGSAARTFRNVFCQCMREAHTLAKHKNCCDLCMVAGEFHVALARDWMPTRLALDVNSSFPVDIPGRVIDDQFLILEDGRQRQGSLHLRGMDVEPPT